MNDTKRTVAVVTGTRAEFGLLRPVMKAIASHPKLNLETIVCGEHSRQLAATACEVTSEFADAQVLDDRDALSWVQDLVSSEIAASPAFEIDLSRLEDKLSVGARIGVEMTALAGRFDECPPDVVLVLGDRIEAFAAAAAASVAGIRVAHMHGGDRAEGIADEALRHAITKLAHVHLPATQTSAMRIIAMGEQPERVHIVGSPAMDGLAGIRPLNENEFTALGSPQIIMLLHPVGEDEQIEHDRAAELIRIACHRGRTLILHPNHDPGRDGIMLAIRNSGCEQRAHLPRDTFIGLLRRAKVILGNSSAGLIECAAIPIRCINVGRRQAGREKPANVTDIADGDYQTVSTAIREALNATPLKIVTHPYGNGDTGPQTAELLATFDPGVHSIRKINDY